MANKRKPKALDFPPVSEALIKALRERYPHKPATPSKSIEEIMYESGKAVVVTFLEGIHKEQTRA